MNVIIVHGAAFFDKEKIAQGLPPQNKRHWIPWLKENLEKNGIKCFTPLMPKNWKPDYQDWKNKFEKLPIKKDSILIGTSAGGAFLVRWLGETKQKIKKLILVSPAKICPDFYEDYFKEFYNFEINKDVRKHAGEVIIFISNDSENIISSTKIYYKELGATLIELPNKGHFIEKHMKTKEFPELLEEVLKTFK